MSKILVKEFSKNPKVYIWDGKGIVPNSEVHMHRYTQAHGRGKTLMHSVLLFRFKSTYGTSSLG